VVSFVTKAGKEVMRVGAGVRGRIVPVVMVVLIVAVKIEGYCHHHHHHHYYYFHHH